ncbi:MAG TPA: hypothetical protein VFB74_20575 [Kribbellaceae bacterium]|nr:hypothetical protein [Kribbellaceae bacterium]
MDDQADLDLGQDPGEIGGEPGCTSGDREPGPATSGPKGRNRTPWLRMT